MDERTAFEKWFTHENPEITFPFHRSGGAGDTTSPHYAYAITDMAWGAWQARAELAKDFSDVFNAGNEIATLRARQVEQLTKERDGLAEREAAWQAAAKDLLDWVPTCSEGSSGYTRIEKLKAVLSDFGKGGSLKQAVGVEADLKHPAKSDTGGEIAEALDYADVMLTTLRDDGIRTSPPLREIVERVRQGKLALAEYLKGCRQIDEANYVAWLRYVPCYQDAVAIRVCDSDAPGAFKVYRRSGPQPIPAKPQCVGYKGGCDGNLVGLEHEPNCPAAQPIPEGEKK